MQALQNCALLSNDTHAMDQLQDFLHQRREAHEPVEDLNTFEQELHRLFVAAEREALSHDHPFTAITPRSRSTGSGTIVSCGVLRPIPVRRDLVRVTRSLYHRTGGRAVCPLELHAGLIEAPGHRWLRSRRPGCGAFDAPRGGGTLCPLGQHDAIEKHPRSVAESPARPLGAQRPRFGRIATRKRSRRRR